MRGALQKLLVILATEQPLTTKKKVCFCPFFLVCDLSTCET